MAKQKSLMTIGEESGAFYWMIGNAITQWSFVEQALFNIASLSFSNKDRSTLAAGFMSIENFRSKLAFVDRTFTASQKYEAFAVDWAEARDHVRSQSYARNELAHSTVIIFGSAQEGRRYAIVPLTPIRAKKKPSRNSPPPGSLCVRDIDLIQQQFSKATLMLWSLHLRMSDKEDPFAKHAQREPQPRPLNDIARQMRAMLGPHPQSSHA